MLLNALLGNPFTHELDIMNFRKAGMLNCECLSDLVATRPELKHITI